MLKIELFLISEKSELFSKGYSMHDCSFVAVFEPNTLALIFDNLENYFDAPPVIYRFDGYHKLTIKYRNTKFLNLRAPLKTPFCILGESFSPTLAYKNLERHTVFLRLLTQNLKKNLSPSPSKKVFRGCLKFEIWKKRERFLGYSRTFERKRPYNIQILLYLINLQITSPGKECIPTKNKGVPQGRQLPKGL